MALSNLTSNKINYALMKNVFAVIIVMFFGIQASFAQKAIQLTKVSTGKKHILLVGHRVEYTLKSKPQVHYIGLIDSVNETSVVIQGTKISYEELKSIGRRRKGSGFFASALGFFGAAAVVSAFKEPEDPCPSCIDSGSSGEGLTVLGGIAGAGLLGLSINTVARNSPRDLIKKWKLEIINQPVDSTRR